LLLPEENRLTRKETVKTTIQQLIEETNKDPRRGYGHENVLTEIAVDRDTTENLLEKLGYTLDTIPAKDEVVYLKSTANLSTGGTLRET